MAPKAQQPLTERIAEMRAEIDIFLDACAAELVESCPNIPLGVLRKSLVGNNSGCACSAAMEIQKQRDKSNAMA